MFTVVRSINCWDCFVTALGSSRFRAANEMRRDEQLENNDNIEILIDTYHDHRNGFYFSTNPLGLRRDALIADEGKTVNDDWNCVWYVKSRVTDEGWIAEIAIPFNQLRFKEHSPIVWGINIGRNICRKREQDYWVPVPRDFGFRGFYRVSNAGHLLGLREIKPGRYLQIQRRHKSHCPYYRKY